VFDADWWKDIQQLIEILTPLNKAILKFENDCTLLSTVFPEWTSFFTTFSMIYAPEIPNIINMVQARWEYMYHPIFIIAYLLDPHNRTQSHTIPTHHFDSIVQFVANRGGGGLEAVAQLGEYISGRNVFSPSFFYNSITHPQDYWGVLFAHARELSDLALRIFSLTTSSASTERSFSTQGTVHSMARCYLLPDKVKKLVYLYRNYPLLRPNDPFIPDPEALEDGEFVEDEDEE